jgi:hypothetical protein
MIEVSDLTAMLDARRQIASAASVAFSLTGLIGILAGIIV